MVPRIDVKNSIARKSFTGTLEFSFRAEQGLLDIPYTELASPVTAVLYYEILADDKVEVTGTLTFSLKGLCSRCLEEAEEKIAYEAEGIFSLSPKDEEYGYCNGLIDLREFLRDSVLFALPSRLLCSSCAEESE